MTGKRIEPETRTEMIRYYKKGMTVREIMFIFGRSYGGVYGVLQRASVKMRPRSAYKKKKK